MKNSPKTVTPSIPLNTATPSATRISAPAPLASTSGTTPRMKAKEVIKIGRSRKRQASTVASIRLAPWSCFCLANSTIRMAFLAARPIKHDQADLGEDVVVHLHQPDPRDRRQQAHGDDQNDRQRQRPAFILRRQHQEHEDHRQREGQLA